MDEHDAQHRFVHNRTLAQTERALVAFGWRWRVSSTYRRRVLTVTVVPIPRYRVRFGLVRPAVFDDVLRLLCSGNACVLKTAATELCPVGGGVIRAAKQRVETETKPLEDI